MLKRIIAGLKLVLLVQHRSHFVPIYFGVAIGTVLAFRLAIPERWIPWALPAILLGEPGTMGIYLVAAHRYLEKNDRSWTALLVSPLGLREYLVALTLGSALIATGAGTLIFAVVVGPDRRALLAMPPILLTATMAGLIGFGLTLRHSEFTRFLLGSIPVVTIYSLPFLSLFDVVPEASLRFCPSTASLSAFRLLLSPEPSLTRLALEVLILVAFNLAGFFYVGRQLEDRLELELA